MATKSSSNKIKMEYIPIDLLKHDETNPNVMGEAEERAVEQSIREYGFIIPVIISQEKDVFVIVQNDRNVELTNNLKKWDRKRVNNFISFQQLYQ